MKDRQLSFIATITLMLVAMIWVWSLLAMWVTCDNAKRLYHIEQKLGITVDSKP